MPTCYGKFLCISEKSSQFPMGMNTHSLLAHPLDSCAYYPLCQRKGQKSDRDREKRERKISVRREKRYSERKVRGWEGVGVCLKGCMNLGKWKVGNPKSDCRL